ncbi:MAG: ATPase, T2SS/T4P/T4SS family [Alphaproteobacteria bacterium]|nr:ATPase, T2SS/T4P/T4SS family [Alphaproteobacteria bacterium]
MAEEKALKDKSAPPKSENFEMSPENLSELSMTPDEKDVQAVKPALELEKPAEAGINLSTANLPAGGDVKNKRIGDKLVEQGLISPDQLKVALYEKQRSTRLIGEILVDMGFISSEVLSTFLAESTGLQQFDPKKTMLDPTSIDIVPKRDALKYQMIPVTVDRIKNTAVMAMADPYDVVALDKLKQLLPRGCAITTLVCPPEILADTIHKSYGVTTSIDGILKELAGDAASTKINLETLTEDEAYSHPIVRLVNALVFEAVKMGASDLHFEPEESFIRLRYRVDGDLVTVHTMHKEYWNGISQRLKIMSEMNIADKLMPQDGRFNLNVGGREADFRVSSLPTVHGENIVLRVLDKSASIVPLDKLGFSEHNMKLIEKCQARPEGIIIVTGPTGSGKTTTLYSMLNAVNTPDVNIQTLEDPVEYSLGLIRQTHVREGAGLGFGEGIKALLRQDPDIIFIGEVRDKVTAEQSLKAAMTGHQVYTSLHTNDCFGAIPRLVDMGMQPGMLAGAIIATFAQRLVRKLCPKCKVGKAATPEEVKLLRDGPDGNPIDPAKPPTIYHPGGCPECNNTGYKGRVACIEILYFDEEMDDVVASGSHKSAMKKLARTKGFRSMLDDGILKIYEGTTTLESVRQTLNFADRM